MTFGTFRFVLAYFVVISHISNKYFPYIGNYAVSGFFILSGYLMTYILNKTYGFDLGGVKKYIFNRFLRIYPTYYLVLLLSVFLLLLPGFSEIALSLNPSLKIPEFLSSWIHNFSIIGLGSYFVPSREAFRIIPPAWALHNELIFYLLIPFLGRNMKIASIWFFFSFILAIYLFYIGRDWGTRYNTLEAASLPFSLGSYLFYIKNKFPLVKNIFTSKFLCGFFLMLFLVVNFFPNISSYLSIQVDYRGVFYYINMFITFLFIACLSELRPKNKRVIYIDNFLGNLSYPIYLIHWFCAVLAAGLFFDLNQSNKLSAEGEYKLLFISSVFIVVFSILIARFFDDKINSIRDSIKK